MELQITESSKKLYLCVKWTSKSLPLFELDSNIKNTTNNSLKPLRNSLLNYINEAYLLENPLDNNDNFI